MRIEWFFIWSNLNPLHPKMHCAKFGSNWSSCSGEKDFFLISSMYIYFRYFAIISPWKRAGPFIWTNLNSHHRRMICAKFGWNWHSCSEEEYFWISSMYRVFLLFFVIISPRKKVRSFIVTNFHPLYPRMVFAKFDLNWPTGFLHTYIPPLSFVCKGGGG